MSTAILNKTDVRLGSYVRTRKYGYTGRVTEVHLEGCPQGAAWQMGQEIPLREDEIHEVWFSVLVHNGGAVVVSASDTEKVEPFDFANPYAAEYFD